MDRRPQDSDTPFVGRRAVVGGLVGASGAALMGACTDQSTASHLAAAPRPPGTIASISRLGWYPAFV